MATLHVRKTGSKGRKLLTLGGDPSQWAVSNDNAELATARLRLASYDLDIDAGGRHLTARMPWVHFGHPKELEVVDDGTGQKVVEGTLTWGGKARPGPYGEEWAVTLATGRTISWFYERNPDKLGFYDTDDAPVLLIGHDPTFDTSAKGGTFRILLRMWGAAAASTDRYVAQVEDGAVGRLVPDEDVPVLALLGMLLERTADSRYAETVGPHV